jgi:hypothetical protein
VSDAPDDSDPDAEDAPVAAPADDDRPAPDAHGPGVPADRTVPVGDDVDDVPTVSCRRCGREWDLSYELDELRVGNQALEQFALDHVRHTGHYPDAVSTWRADCVHCPEGVEQLNAGGVRRWARTHARHTRHDVEVSGPRAESAELVTFEE